MWWHKKEKIVRQKKARKFVVYLYATTEMLWQIVVLRGEDIVYTKAYVFSPKIKSQVCLQARREFKKVLHKLWKGKELQM